MNCYDLDNMKRSDFIYLLKQYYIKCIKSFDDFKEGMWYKFEYSDCDDEIFIEGNLYGVDKVMEFFE